MILGEMAVWVCTTSPFVGRDLILGGTLVEHIHGLHLLPHCHLTTTHRVTLQHMDFTTDTVLLSHAIDELYTMGKFPAFGKPAMTKRCRL
jgi:hypothetical protein